MNTIHFNSKASDELLFLLVRLDENALVFRDPAVVELPLAEFVSTKVFKALFNQQLSAVAGEV